MKPLIKSLGLAAIAAVTLSSCLKDKNIEDQEYGMTNYTSKSYVELPAPPDHVLTIALDYVDSDTLIDLVYAGIAQDRVASEDITVTLTLANTTDIVNQYNVDHGLIGDPGEVRQFTNYYYTLQGPLSVTIPRGSRMASVKALINPTRLSVDSTYGIGFTISAVDKQGYPISQNFNKVLVLIGAKNKYDGHYNIRFKMLDWDALFGITNQLFVWPSAYGVQMITSGANSVRMYSPGHGTFIHVAATSAGGLTGFGSTTPRFVFDLGTDAMTDAVNDFIGPRLFEMNPAVTTSKFVPESGSSPAQIYAAIIMKQAGRPDLQIYDTLTYVGPR